ncbi:MAG: RNA methyltransferase [Lachnospiraceae bacterium]|nr:RNA methyltransferase [Lachnospiraceae bacterium]
MRIDSAKSSQVKQVAALQKKARLRREQGVFVVEGLKMVLEAPRERLLSVYASDSFLEESGEEALKGIPFTAVSDNAFKAMADTQTPQGVLAVVKTINWKREDFCGKDGALLLFLENLQDPGNLGTIFRAGEGAGVTGILMSRDTVDVYNPKVIRSTMGSIYRVPFAVCEDLETVLAECRKVGITSYGAHLEGEKNYEEADYGKSSAFLIGNEGAGLSEKLSEAADFLVKIPMEGRVESLNAAVAASVFMYEAARQRRQKQGKINKE